MGAPRRRSWRCWRAWATPVPDWRLSLVAASEGPFVDRARALGVDVAVLPFPARLAAVGEWAAGSSAAAACGLRLRASWRRPPPSATRGDCAASSPDGLPDIVQSNGVKMHLLATWVAPRAAAVVWHVHDYVGTRAFTSRALRWMARSCDAVVANSDSVARRSRAGAGCARAGAPGVERRGPGAVLEPGPCARPRPSGRAAARRRGRDACRSGGHLRALEGPRDLPAGARHAAPYACGVRGYVVGGPVYATDASQVSLDELRR